MKAKVWEVILCREGRFRREYLEASTEIRARDEARKRYAVDGWSIFNVREVKVAEVE